MANNDVSGAAVVSSLSPSNDDDAARDNGGGSGSVEMAYLLLQGCEVRVASGEEEGEDEGASSCPLTPPPVGKWLNVRVVSRRGSAAAAAERNFDDDEPDEGEISTDQLSRCCRECFVSLKRNENRNGATAAAEHPLELDIGEIRPFDGTEGRVICEACRSARSDASLLLGLLKATADCVSFERCSVLLSSSPGENSQTISTRTASFVVTLSFPHLFSEGRASRRHILPRNLGATSNFNKPLPLALQLLLSLVRSDWSALRDMMRGACANGRKGQSLARPARPSLFPTKNSLEGLYKRIQGSTAASDELESHARVPLNERLRRQPAACRLLRLLPREVLVERIAPFLRARSLDSLRCSCSYLHKALSATVPGLKLRLYSHQIKSLEWMRERECRSVVEADCLDLSSSSSNRFSQCEDGDLHRAVTGGLTVLLRQRPDGRSPHIALAVRLNQHTGREWNEFEDATFMHRKVARGGLLCDEPGLGKTITFLSLILQTQGLTTTTRIRVGELEAADRTIFDSYWAETVTKEYRIPILNRLLNDLLKCNRGRGYFLIDKIRRSIASDSYTNFESFETDVEDAISSTSGLGYNTDEEAKSEGRFLSSQFKILVQEMKDRQMRSAKKSFSNNSGRHKSRVAGYIAQQTQQKFIESLVPTSATLIVIPSALMGHWRHQLNMHVDMSYATSKKPLIFHYGKKDPEMTVDKAIILCKLHKTHAPLVFLDEAGTRPLPDASFLAMFQMVITTTDRFKNEWSKGSFQSELKRSEMTNGAPLYRGFSEFDEPEEACPLLKVNWHRMVVDEGHSMAKGTNSSTIQFASWVTAQRRWAMTGTPTKQTASELRQVKGLVVDFLQHAFFSRQLEGDKHWKTAVSRQWRDGALASFFRLRSLLGLLMKRHTKHDIAELPPPRFHQIILPMSLPEAVTYNTLVGAVQSNLLVTSMAAKTSGEQDSLLHRSHRSQANQALENIRRVCVGWTRVIPKLSHENFLETLQLLDGHGIDTQKIEEIRQYLHKPENEELSPCGCCGLNLSTLLLLPCCAGLVCTECMDNKSKICIVCDQSFDADEFQLLQPGFDFKWKSNLEHQAAKKSLKDEMSQASGAQQPTTSNTGEAAAPMLLDAQILIRPNPKQNRTRRPGDGHICVYDRFAVDGKCLLCLQEHDACKLLQKRSRCDVCFKPSEECPDEESKSAYLCRSIEKLLANATTYKRPLKVIIFSQFRKVVNVVGDRLIRRFGRGCVAEYWGRFRTQEADKFTFDKDCFCMLLSNDGSTGLDLSFVTNIFFLVRVLSISIMPW